MSGVDDFLKAINKTNRTIHAAGNTANEITRTEKNVAKTVATTKKIVTVEDTEEKRIEGENGRETAGAIRGGTAVDRATIDAMRTRAQRDAMDAALQRPPGVTGPAGQPVYNPNGRSGAAASAPSAGQAQTPDEKMAAQLAEKVALMQASHDRPGGLAALAEQVTGDLNKKASYTLDHDITVAITDGKGKAVGVATIAKGAYSPRELMDAVMNAQPGDGVAESVKTAVNAGFDKKVAQADDKKQAPATGAGTATQTQSNNERVADNRDYGARVQNPVPPVAEAQTGTPAPAAHVASAEIPAANGKAFALSRGADGKTIDTKETFPKLSANQIKALQEMVGAKPDGLYGPETHEKTKIMCAKAGIKIEDLDLMTPNNPKLQQFAAAAKAGHDTQVAAAPAPAPKAPEHGAHAHPVADVAKAAVKAAAAVLTGHVIRNNPEILVMNTADNLQATAAPVTLTAPEFGSQLLQQNAFTGFAAPAAGGHALFAQSNSFGGQAAPAVLAAAAAPAPQQQAPAQASPPTSENQAAAILGNLSSPTFSVASAGVDVNQGRG